MKQVDARGIPCPKPLILTKQALKTLPLNEKILILLDDDVAFSNIKDFLNDLKLEYTVEERNFTITKNKDIDEKENSSDDKITVAVVDKAFMGLGDEELGKLLLKAFLGSLASASPKPKAVYFYNGGVLLLKDNAYKQIFDDLRKANIKLYFCGTCIKYFGMDNLVGIEEQTNMLGIVEAMGKAQSVVRI